MMITIQHNGEEKKFNTWEEYKKYWAERKETEWEDYCQEVIKPGNSEKITKGV